MTKMGVLHTILLDESAKHRVNYKVDSFIGKTVRGRGQNWVSLIFCDTNETPMLRTLVF